MSQNKQYFSFLEKSESERKHWNFLFKYNVFFLSW